MLSFMWVLGDMTDNSPEEIPVLLADLANVDEEHVDVGFEKGNYGVGVLADRWKVIQWASACISGNRYYDGPIP